MPGAGAVHHIKLGSRRLRGSLGERGEKRLRFRNLGKLRRRRKAFERRREDVMGVRGAACGVEMLRQRDRGLEFEGAGALLPRWQGRA
jgi:hypothetical protein